jgi:diguanylate cyclase (GGDEF)-like protein
VATPSVNRADGYRNAVSDLGHDVVVVRDGQDAHACLASRGSPVLLIADLSLPKLDTFTLLKHLRRDASHDRTAVIVVSAYEQLRSSARSMADGLGIARVLASDVDRTSLMEAVKSVLPGPAANPAPAPAAVPARSAGRSPHIQEIIGSGVLEAARRFGTPACCVYVRIKEQERFAAYVSSGDAPPAIGPHAEEWALVKQVAATGEPLVLADLHSHPGLRESLGIRSSLFRGFVGVPLFVEHVGVCGAICLLDNEPTTLSAADMDSLAALASELERQIESTAGTNGRHSNGQSLVTPTIDVETLERLAVTDPLTGLANRRGGERSVASEISRARRQRTALSCIFIDIDNFKRINDTFGHQAGDRLLRDLSDLLRHTLRAYDILVRWGGEEFLLILPGVTLEQARKLAERIRQAVERLDTQGLGAVTISAGTAALDSSYDFETMLMAADRRLYEAKSTGRNTIV